MSSPEGGRRLALRAPAKVNLGLRLTGLRDDGYHLLESLFVPIDLHDEITVDWDPTGPARTDLEVALAADAGLPPALAGVTAGPDNLVVRAAEAFRAASGLPGRLALRLEKRIPAGAGLGGGSSDAGAVLAGLSRLAGEEGIAAPRPTELAALALQLGADVPYFLAPTPAFVSGIGERIEPVEGLPPLALVVANPGISVATAEVYRATDALGASLTGKGAGSTMRAFSRLTADSGDRAAALRELLQNDLAPAALRLCPPIGRWLDLMRAVGAIGVGMSGSGGSLFGVFESDAAARDGAHAFARRVDGHTPDSATADTEEVGATASSPETTGGGWLRVTRVRTSEPDDRFLGASPNG